MMTSLVNLLHKENYSCVIFGLNETRSFSRRGVMNLYDLLLNDRTFLKGALVAAASLMILGEIGELHADVISTPALSLLRNASVKVSFGCQVPYIKNRNQDGWCPLESACFKSVSAISSFTIVQDFMQKKNVVHRGRRCLIMQGNTIFI